MKIKFRKILGFTLIEVMVAMAVFSLAGVALLGVADNHYRNIGLLEQKMFANWVASNQLVEAKLKTNWPPKNGEKGSVELAGTTWYWQQNVIKTTNKELRAVIMEVRLDEDDEKPVASMMTYFSQENP